MYVCMYMNVCMYTSYCPKLRRSLNLLFTINFLDGPKNEFHCF